ncbi:hypothetical protein VRU48_03765 [Pedobacter sp. KR3-3]|uniref:Uncharacterized protein n=1 Tax=Pedobacter albus TaxID=3113905 RepID=A0ABU7I4C5_9SPHI|nr:hypothetical protein [Pedobacter sp. KR3-3]MEE1944211.1 hypothetical protein [Pedobacter sp. KR3-3]
MPYLLKYKATIIGFILLAFLFSCSPKLHQNYVYNRYQRSFNIHILNDSLQLHLTSPADIKYSTDKKSFKDAWPQSRFKTANEILLLGTTTTPPYEFAVSIGNAKEPVQRGDYKTIDTLLNGYELHFMARTDSVRAVKAMEADLNAMVKSLKSGADYKLGTSSVMDIVSASMNKNQFYQTLSEIEQFPIPQKQGNSLELQMQLTYASFLLPNQQYDYLIGLQESSFKPNDTVLNKIKTNSIHNNEAIDRILAEAQKAQVLMINENHYYPQHRLLVTELLPRLKSLGYDYLALEALATPNDSLLNSPGAFPTLNTGFYTREQNYGNLLREAIKLGFKLVAYENTDDKQDREIGQADNLYNRTLAIDPHAKVLVLVGIDHLLEKPTTRGKKWMATVFKEKYQIDPLTISQTHLNLYRKYSPSAYSLLSQADLADEKKYGAIDFYVLNNQQRPIVQHGVAYRNKFGVPVQVALFYAKEQKTATDFYGHIPYFTQLVAKNEKLKLPIEPQTNALLVVYDAQGYILAKKTIGNP